MADWLRAQKEQAQRSESSSAAQIVSVSLEAAYTHLENHIKSGEVCCADCLTLFVDHVDAIAQWLDGN